MSKAQIIGLGIIAVVVACMVRFSEGAVDTHQETRWIDNSAVSAEPLPVDVEAQMARVQNIELAPVVITAKRAPRAVHQDAQCGAFNYRDLTQGSGQVRGFCTH